MKEGLFKDSPASEEPPAKTIARPNPTRAHPPVAAPGQQSGCGPGDGEGAAYAGRRRAAARTGSTLPTAPNCAKYKGVQIHCQAPPGLAQATEGVVVTCGDDPVVAQVQGQGAEGLGVTQRRERLRVLIAKVIGAQIQVQSVKVWGFLQAGKGLGIT